MAFNGLLESTLGIESCSGSAGAKSQSYLTNTFNEWNCSLDFSSASISNSRKDEDNESGTILFEFSRNGKTLETE